MRKIKFRVWYKLENEMMYWDKYADEIKDAIPYDAGDEYTEQCVLMQYTGMKDCEGKEIYEGDLLLFNDDIYRVYFEEEVAAFGMYRTLDGELYFEEYLGDYGRNSKVIGNIYED